MNRQKLYSVIKTSKFVRMLVYPIEILRRKHMMLHEYQHSQDVLYLQSLKGSHQEEDRMQNCRENNFDLMRVVCCVAVIALHASGLYFYAYTDPSNFGTVYTDHFVSTCMTYCPFFFAVPCFVMLSGAFLLANENNMDWHAFYCKQFKKFGIPTILFSVLYSFYNVLKALALMRLKDLGIEKLLTTLWEIICGQPFYHMWFLYTLLGVYLMVPFILRFKEDIGEEAFEKFAWIFLLLACLSVCTSKHALSWDIGAQLRYSAYFMTGYVLRKKAHEHKNNIQGISLICAGGGVGLLITWAHVALARAGLIDSIDRELLRGNLSPQYIIMSVLIFTGFARLNVRHDFSKPAADTFYIYLFHAGILSVLRGVMRFIVGPGDSRLMIPLLFIATWSISLLLTRMLKSCLQKQAAHWN